MSTTLQARVGRQKQRYDNNLRLVAGCIPYRLKLDVPELEVLMISTPNRNDLIFPKGGWEDDETVQEAACREALEESGVRGIIDEIMLGVWEFRSKSKQNSCSMEGSCKGYMFALLVTEQLDTWPEKDTYQRRWVNVTEAGELCRYDWMREALSAFLRLQSAKCTSPPNMPVPLSHFYLEKPSESERMDMTSRLHVDDGFRQRRLNFSSVQTMVIDDGK